MRNAIGSALRQARMMGAVGADFRTSDGAHYALGSPYGVHRVAVAVTHRGRYIGVLCVWFTNYLAAKLADRARLLEVAATLGDSTPEAHR